VFNRDPFNFDSYSLRVSGSERLSLGKRRFSRPFFSSVLSQSQLRGCTFTELQTSMKRHKRYVIAQKTRGKQGNVTNRGPRRRNRRSVQQINHPVKSGGNILARRAPTLHYGIIFLDQAFKPFSSLIVEHRGIKRFQSIYETFKVKSCNSLRYSRSSEGV